jgi:hypothetical protein
MLRALLLSLCFAGAIVAPAVAAETKGPPRPAPAASFASPDALADAYFGSLKSGSFDVESNRLLAPLMAQKPAEVQNLIAQTNIVMRMYGKVRGWEMMRERALSPSFVERFYLLKLDGPIFYRIMFYKSDGDWTIYSVSFFDQYEKVGFPAS